MASSATWHCSVVSSHQFSLTWIMGIWSKFLCFVANPGSQSGCLRGVPDLSQCICEAGVGITFVRRPESGKTLCTSLLSSAPSAAAAMGGKKVRRTESRMKETEFYNLFRRSHLFNGKICLQYFVCYVLYIKCKIILSKLWKEFQFENCALKKKKK